MTWHAKCDMKVLALISGGKDSCYNAWICEKYGHEIVALGNLLPLEDDREELDSYMYQTVGHGLIEAYSKCTGLPLFRRKIRGSSVNQDLIYEEGGEGSGDEVEDLMALVVYAKQHTPCIGAVASGAIASDYQRSRVERVCGRLGLVSLFSSPLQFTRGWNNSTVVRPFCFSASQLRVCRISLEKRGNVIS